MKIFKAGFLVMFIVGLVFIAISHLWMVFDPSFNPIGALALALFSYALTTIGLLGFILIYILERARVKRDQEYAAEDDIAEIIEEDPEYKETLEDLRDENQ